MLRQTSSSASGSSRLPAKLRRRSADERSMPSTTANALRLAYVTAASLLTAGCATEGNDASRLSDATRKTQTISQPLTSESTATARACLNWFAGVAALVCNDAQLRESLDQHRLAKRSSLRITVIGQKAARIGSAPGVIQVILQNGWPFEPGQKLRIDGKARRGTLLLVGARDRSRGEGHWSVGQALFSDLGLEHGGKSILFVGGDANALTYELERPDGRRVPPDVVWFHRS